MTPTPSQAYRPPRIRSTLAGVAFAGALAIVHFRSIRQAQLAVELSLPQLALVLAMSTLLALALAWRLRRADPRLHWAAGLLSMILFTLPTALAVMVGVALMCAPRRLWPDLFAAVGLVLVYWTVALVARFGNGADTWGAVLQSHLAESSDFLFGNLDLRELSIGAALATVYLLRGRSAELGRWSVLGTVALVFWATATGMIELSPTLRNMQTAARSQVPLVDPAPRVAESRAPLRVVWILGESTTRWHLQLYGYPYETTPNLMRRRDELVRFDDAISSYSYTVPSLTDVLVRKTAAGNESLVARLRASGVQVHWLSSQARLGAWDTPIRRIAEQADQMRFFANPGVTLPLGLNRRLGIGEGFVADRMMIDHLVAELRGAPQGPELVVGHLTVGHADYCRLIPHDAAASFEGRLLGPAYFGDAPDHTTDVNCYDAAMRYLDGLLERVIQAADESPVPTLFVFSPDHGEDPDAGTAHSAAQHTAKQIEIPILIRANAAGRAQLAETIRLAQDHQRMKFFLPWIHESLLDLFGLADDADKTKSVFSASYVPGERVVFRDEAPMYYDSSVDGDRKDKLHRAQLNIAEARRHQLPSGGRLLADRSNSERALIEAMTVADGAAMDIAFDPAARRFEVRPPLAAPVGFTLERALEVARRWPDKPLWLVWHNPSGATMDAAVADLERLDRRHGLKDRAWIETGPGFADPARRLLSAAGFRHSQPLDPRPELRSACRANPLGPDCARAVDELARTELRTANGCVSIDATFAAIGNRITQAFPDLCTLSRAREMQAFAPTLMPELAAAGRHKAFGITLGSPYVR